MIWNGKHCYEHVLPIWSFTSVFPQDHIFKAKVKCMPLKCMPAWLGMMIFFFKEKQVFCWDPLVLLGFVWMCTIHVLGMNSIILRGGRETYFYYLLAFILLLFQTALSPLLSDGHDPEELFCLPFQLDSCSLVVFTGWMRSFTLGVL